jgi:hypothetical protein
MEISDRSMSVFSPAGPTPRLEGFPLVTPAVQGFLMTLGPALVLFFVLHAVSPTILIVESQIRQPPWVTLDAVFEADPDFARGIGRIIAPRMVPVSAAKAVAAQTIYVLAGSFLLSLWLRRERRGSRMHHLALAVLLLGLAAFGTSLGFLVWEDREPVVRIINVFLTAVVRPWLALPVCGSHLILAGLLDRWRPGRLLIRSADGGSPVR